MDDVEKGWIRLDGQGAYADDDGTFSLSRSLSLSFFFSTLMTFPEAYDRIHPFYRQYAIKQAKNPPPATFEEGRAIQKQQYRAERDNVPNVLCNSYTIPVDDTQGDINNVQVYVIRPSGTETTILPVMVFV